MYNTISTSEAARLANTATLIDETGLFWNRDLSEDSLEQQGFGDRACEELASVLRLLRATLLVKGHDITGSGKVSQRCFNPELLRFQVILADTMMSFGYTGNDLESKLRTVALEWYGNSFYVRAAYPLQEPQACHDLQPKGCTDDLLLRSWDGRC